MNEYTSKDTPIAEGAVYVFSSKKNLDKWKPSFLGEIRRVKKNQYKCVKGKKTYFTFTVKDKKTVVVKQKKKVINGINIKGRYKLKKGLFPDICIIA